MDKIFTNKHRDCIAMIQSGGDICKDAIRLHDHSYQKDLIVKAIKTLETGFNKSIAELNALIVSAPFECNFKYPLSYGYYRTKKAERILDLVYETFEALVLDAKTLNECHKALNEPVVAKKALRYRIDFLTECTKKAREKSMKLAPHHHAAEFVDAVGQ
jgi:di/tripeptidase